jgi:hypothetical protein
MTETTEELVAECERLTQQYYELIRDDHHKSRDQYVYVRVIIPGRPGESVRFQALHPGSVSEWDIECASCEEALIATRRELREAIENNTERPRGWYE